jgi:hypothetical protein
MSLPIKIKTALQQGNPLWAEAITNIAGWNAWVQIHPIMRGGRTYRQALDEWTSNRQANEPYDNTISSYNVVYEHFIIGTGEEATQELSDKIKEESLTFFNFLESSYLNFLTQHGINKKEKRRKCRIEFQEWFSQDRMANSIMDLVITVDNEDRLEVNHRLFVNSREEVIAENDGDLFAIISKWVSDLNNFQIGIAKDDDPRLYSRRWM